MLWESQVENREERGDIPLFFGGLSVEVFEKTTAIPRIISEWSGEEEEEGRRKKKEEREEEKRWKSTRRRRRKKNLDVCRAQRTQLKSESQLPLPSRFR